jgi:fatty acid desaturase
VHYHLEHHLAPHVPFYRLPRLHAALRIREYQEHAPLLQRGGDALRALVR